jgi:hypothetical protein
MAFHTMYYSDLSVELTQLSVPAAGWSSSFPVVKSALVKVVALGLVLCVLVACSSPAESLAATLPTRIGDTIFDPDRVID